MVGLLTMSRGHGRVERVILETLKWDRKTDNRGVFSLGNDTEFLAY